MTKDFHLSPLCFDWKCPLADVLGVLRLEYAERFPLLASERLSLVSRVMENDDSLVWLPVLGQEMEALGLALVELIEGDDAIYLYVSQPSSASRVVAQIEAAGWEAHVHRQDGQAPGACARFPAPPAEPLVSPTAYVKVRIHAWIDAGLAIGRVGAEDQSMLLDLRQCPQISGIRNNIWREHETGYLWARKADQSYAWVARRPSKDTGQDHDVLCYVQDLLGNRGSVNTLSLPPPESRRQRRLPRYALGFSGDDLLLVDRNMIFIYRGFGCGTCEIPAPKLLLEVPTQHRFEDVSPSIAQTSDGRTCISCRGQFFEWCRGDLKPLPFPRYRNRQEEARSLVPSRTSCVAWIQQDYLCEGNLDTGEVVPFQIEDIHDVNRLENVHKDWLLLCRGHQPHRSSDIAQLWHLESGRIARIPYGALSLEGSIDYWIELPGGEILVGDHRQCANLGRFDELIPRLYSGRLFS